MLTTAAFLSLNTQVLRGKHRRRSDWNSGGTHGGTYYKSPAVEAKKNTFFYIVMQVIWCLKVCNMTKSGGGQSSHSKF